MITTQQGADGIIPRILAPSQTGFSAKNDLSSYLIEDLIETNIETNKSPF